MLVWGGMSNVAPCRFISWMRDCRVFGIGDGWAGGWRVCTGLSAGAGVWTGGSTWPVAAGGVDGAWAGAFVVAGAAFWIGAEDGDASCSAIVARFRNKVASSLLFIHRSPFNRLLVLIYLD